MAKWLKMNNLFDLIHPGSMIIHTSVLCTAELNIANVDVRVFLSSHTKLRAEMELDKETVAKSAEKNTTKRPNLNSLKLANKALLW